MNPAFPFHVFPSKSKQKQKQKLKVEQVVNPPKHKTPPFYKFRSFVVAHPKFEKILNDQNTIEHLCLNPNAMHIIEQPEFLQKVCWSSLMKNPAAMSLLEANPNRVCHLISSNPHAEYLLCKRPELIGSWYASNNPRMINFLKTNPHQIFWPKLSMNPAAGELLWTHYNCQQW
jgi:hypothetical protein